MKDKSLCAHGCKINLKKAIHHHFKTSNLSEDGWCRGKRNRYFENVLWSHLAGLHPCIGEIPTCVRFNRLTRYCLSNQIVLEEAWRFFWDFDWVKWSFFPGIYDFTFGVSIWSFKQTQRWIWLVVLFFFKANFVHKKWKYKHKLSLIVFLESEWLKPMTTADVIKYIDSWNHTESVTVIFLFCFPVSDQHHIITYSECLMWLSEAFCNLQLPNLSGQACPSIGKFTSLIGQSALMVSLGTLKWMVLH